MNNIRKTIKLYLSAAVAHKRWLILHLSAVSLGVIADNIIQPYIFSKGVNVLPNFIANGGNFGAVFGKYIIAYIGIALISWCFWRFSGFAYIKFEIPVMRDLYRRVFGHLTNMSNKFFSNTFSGSLVAQTNRFISSFETIYDTISFDVTQLLIKFIFSSIILLTFAPTIAIGLFVWSIIYIVIAVWLSFKKLPLSKKAATRQSETSARLADNLTNVANIKYFAREKFEIKQFSKITHKLAQAETWDWGIQEIIFGLQSLLIVIFQAIAFWLSLKMAANHQINFGQFVLIQSYVVNVFTGLWNISRIVRRFESSFANANEMTEILNTEPEITDAKDYEPCIATDGLIEFKNVLFDHEDAKIGDPLFKDLSLMVKPGERVGLAGPSGGGKTTLTKLLLRMADIDEGTISIDGQDIAKLRQSDLRKCITYVPQEPILFHRSLLENIRYGRPTASIEEVQKAAAKAHADTFIEKLPDKYETLVGERGVKLSGGQRQRVAIARAILKDAPILVLDEATSALDSGSEKLIQDALWQLMQGRTAIVVAHRLSTIQKLDRIVVLDDGNIVEDGPHAELISKKGLYAKLWSHQTGGFLKD